MRGFQICLASALQTARTYMTRQHIAGANHMERLRGCLQCNSERSLVSWAGWALSELLCRRAALGCRISWRAGQKVPQQH